MSTQVCPLCKGEREQMVDCRACWGTGALHNVGWATEPWTEIIPNLWVGGHDYNPHTFGPAHVVTQDDLDAAGFDVVVSLYQREEGPHFHTSPGDGRAHYTLAVPDDTVMGLYVDEIKAIDHLSKQVASAVTERKKVLVRCQAGLNRSSLTAGLALVRMGYQPQRVIDMIRAKRSPFALFNQRFVEIILAQSKEAS